MAFDFFGKDPKAWKPSIQNSEEQAQRYLSIGNTSFTMNLPTSTWHANYNSYLNARWPEEHRSTPAWYDRRMVRFDLLRPLHHGSYDYAHEFFCATVYPIKALGFAAKSLFTGLMCLFKCDIGGALLSVAEVCAALMLICYSILTSCLGLIIRPLISIPVACKKIMEQPQILSSNEHSAIDQTAAQRAPCL